MERILLDNLPKNDKVIKASEQLSGLGITTISGTVRKNMNRELIFLNSILTQYPIKTFDDYRQITSLHLEQMIHALSRLCQILKKAAIRMMPKGV
jgi:hypothetical protein